MSEIKKILVGIDIQNVSGEILECAIKLSRLDNASLTVIYGCPSYTNPSLDNYLPTDITRKVKEDSTKQLREYCEKIIPRSVEWESIVRERQSHHTHHEIVKLADEISADMVVIGDHDKHGLEQWLGTNSDKIIRRAPCTVVVVKEKRC
ncbi:MAG: universal stress protein [Proteobacteria bacterium]|nr:universal stress protein [Pseudomonadota bacterium]